MQSTCIVCHDLQTRHVHVLQCMKTNIRDQLKLHVLVIDHENLLNDFFESEDIIKLIWRKA